MWERPGMTSEIHCSLVISVLASYDVVRRQCRYLKTSLPDDWELVLLDDGSQPPIPMPETRPRHFTLITTRDTRRWTQALARNLGARLARGKYVFFTDIDHIVSLEAFADVSRFAGSRMLFPRAFAVLDDDGQVRRDPELLRAQGWKDEEGVGPPRGSRVHQNTFAIRRDLFVDGLQGGYDESLCGQGHYVPEDVEINGRYAQLVAAGRAAPDVLGREMYVYPDPASSDQFHDLERT